MALDYNTRFLTGLPDNVTIRQADVRDNAAFEEHDYFDLAHCRLLLIWMADPVAVLRRMAASLRPGGVLTLIFRADGLPALLDLVDGFGGVTVMPVHPKPGTAATTRSA